MSVNARNATVRTKMFWYHGYTFNATPGSRTAIGEAIQNGYVFCLDPESYVDRASAPSGMVIEQTNDTGYCLNVTKPTTGILDLMAGVVVNAPSGGFSATYFNSGGWIELAVAADLVQVLTTASEALVYGGSSATILAPANGSWAAAITALGTNGANIPAYGIRPWVTVTNGASNTLRPCSLNTRLGYAIPA